MNGDKRRKIPSAFRRSLFLFAVTGVVLGGCETELESGSDPVADPTERYEFYGFSILPPSGDDWLVDTSKASLGIPVSFSKEPRAGSSAVAAGHTVVALISARLADVPYHSGEAVLDYLRRALEQEWWGEPRYEPVAFEAVEDTSLGADCLHYTVTVRDHWVPFSVGTVFTFKGRGIRCLHPYDPRLVVDIGYSQRFQQGQWIEAFDAEVAPFLKSLQFTPVLLSPYVAERLDEHAALLRDLKRDADAAEVESHAAKLREVPQDKEIGTFLGFDPSQALKEYAGLLRSLDRKTESKEMEALAERYVRNNYAAFQEMKSNSSSK